MGTYIFRIRLQIEETLGFDWLLLFLRPGLHHITFTMALRLATIVMSPTNNGFARFSLRGGGDNGYFFVKLDFEIAVDQQTRTSDRTFEGVPDPNRQTVPAGQPRPYLVQIRPNLAKYPEHAQNPYFMCSTCS